MKFTDAFFELRGRSRLIIEGLVTVTEYGEEQVYLICRGERIHIWGTGLRLSLLGNGRALIGGRVDGFEFL